MPQSSRFNVLWHDVLESTQLTARARCEQQQAQPGDIVLARLQTGGYGRRGRPWESAPGNLLMTLIEHYDGIDQLGWISFAISLALYDAILPVVLTDSLLQLKWPNDVLLNGGKLSGMLIEKQDDFLLIGIGVNIAFAPETSQKTACINEAAPTMQTPDDILQRFLVAYESWLAQAKEQGIGPLLMAWRGRVVGLGHEITARLANGTVLTGKFADLDDSGALILETPDGRCTLTVADIYLNE